MHLPSDPHVVLRRNHVFDLDGTILDSFPVVAKIFGDVMAQEGVPAADASAYLYANTHARIKLVIPQLLAGRTVSDARIAELYEDFQQRFNASKAEFFPTALPALRALRRRVKGLYLSSLSSDELVTARLEHGGITTGIFDLAFGSTKLTKGPAHVESFARHAGMAQGAFARHAVMWGDTAFDMEMASQAGMYAIGIIGTLTAEELLAAGADEAVPSVAERLAAAGIT
jgi:phosphoglycolate phosphatase